MAWRARLWHTGRLLHTPGLASHGNIHFEQRHNTQHLGDSKLILLGYVHSLLVTDSNLDQMEWCFILMQIVSAAMHYQYFTQLTTSTLSAVLSCSSLSAIAIQRFLKLSSHRVSSKCPSILFTKYGERVTQNNIYIKHAKTKKINHTSCHYQAYRFFRRAQSIRRRIETMTAANPTIAYVATPMVTECSELDVMF